MKQFTFKTSIVARSDDRQKLIDELAATGVFTARDKGALLIMHIDGLRVIHKHLVGKEPVAAEEDDTELEEVTNSLEDFAHCHRPKAFRRKPRAVIPRLAVHGVTDAEAIGMVPPSSRSR